MTEEQKAELQKVVDAEYSHDIETEEEKQQEVLKDVERVTGARSVAVTRYGSYESIHGRKGRVKQGDFERIGGHGDYSISAVARTDEHADRGAVHGGSDLC